MFTPKEGNPTEFNGAFSPSKVCMELQATSWFSFCAHVHVFNHHTYFDFAMLSEDISTATWGFWPCSCFELGFGTLSWYNYITLSCFEIVHRVIISCLLKYHTLQHPEKGFMLCSSYSKDESREFMCTFEMAFHFESRPRKCTAVWLGCLWLQSHVLCTWDCSHKQPI